MSDLKPCPFCGGEAELKRVERTILGTEYFSVICTTCHCQTAGNQDVEKSIAVWNTRKPMEAVVAELNETGRKFCENVGCSKECENCEHGALVRTIIEIVRGKE